MKPKSLYKGECHYQLLSDVSNKRKLTPHQQKQFMSEK